MKLSRTTSEALDGLIDELNQSEEAVEPGAAANSDEYGSFVVRRDDNLNENERDKASFQQALNHKAATWENKLGALMIGEKRSTPSNKQRSPLPKYEEPSLMSIAFGRGRENLEGVNFDFLASITSSDLERLNTAVAKVTPSAAEQVQLEVEKTIKATFSFWKEKTKIEEPEKISPSTYKAKGNIASRWTQSIQQPSETQAKNLPSTPKATGNIASRWQSREAQSLSQPTHGERQERRKLNRDLSLWQNK